MPSPVVIRSSDVRLDLDAVTLESYATGATVLTRPPGRCLALPYLGGAGWAFSLEFSGGFGYQRTVRGAAVPVDGLAGVTAAGVWSHVGPRQADTVEELLARWVAVKVPLRLLDLGLSCVVMEDEERAVSLPVQFLGIRAAL